MVYIILILLFIFILYNLSKKYNNSDHSIYFDIHMNDICKKVNSLENKDENKDELSDLENKNKLSCEKKLVEEQKKNIALRLQYEDPEPNSIDFLYHNNDDFPLYGDDKLTYKMMEMGQKNKQSVINRALWNKNSFLPFIEEELNSHAESIWWDDETLENEF